MQLRHDPIYPSRRSPVLARNVVTTSQPLAAQAGLRMLLAGGNAVDAALAAAIALTVLEPSGNGLGSDAFCILWDGERLHGLNASGRSPKGWTPERFASGMPERGWESVTVPGAVSAWVDLSTRFGKLPFEALFAPAIDYAQNGYAVSPVIAALWARAERMLGGEPGFAECFLPGGRAPKAGEIFRAPAMAESLRAIAESRGEAFLSRRARPPRSPTSPARTARRSTRTTSPPTRTTGGGTVSSTYGDAALHEIPPNGQGIAACMALGICRHLGLERLEADDPQAIHLQIEAMKLAMADADAYVARPGPHGRRRGLRSPRRGLPRAPRGADRRVPRAGFRAPGRRSTAARST